MLGFRFREFRIRGLREVDETNLKLVGDLPLSYSNWSAPQCIATSGVVTECELPDWGVFSFESKVSGAELKEEVGEGFEIAKVRI